ncbi:MAG TPA: toxin-antitoxin system HicB family antitoxin [Acidobacteriaceae bacterium]|jgi:hypothetical protein
MPATKSQAKPAKFVLRMTATLGKEAKELAAREGVSLNQFINLAVAEKVEYLENEAWITRRRPPAQDRIDAAMALLTRKGGESVAGGDEVPEAYKTWEREQQRKIRRKAG